MRVKVLDYCDGPYENLWKEFGHEIVEDIFDADVVQFTGGEDVCPSYYNQPRHPSSYCSPQRDFMEKKYFEECIARDIPMVGICRGGQFLNVMSGGKMYQHASGHGGNHPIVDLFTGKEVIASSTHHQIMVPHDKAVLVAVSQKEIDVIGYSEMQSRFVEMRIIRSAEVVYYPLTRCLCFQPHPEFGSRELVLLQEYYFELIRHYIEEVETSRVSDIKLNIHNDGVKCERQGGL